ncbi:MAG: T9SS type A sorting domain-containing protein [Bacteroidota bacterium]|nr:T9SS type A sorting domain-containing protein [Bacteroidota bacterium]
MKTVHNHVLFISFTLLVIAFNVHAQSYTVQGSISASTTPVKYALVTFIDNSDTAKKFSSLTDTSGNYKLDVVVTSVKPNNVMPARFELEQNYPNPFSSSTEISYKLDQPSQIKVTIFDILGRKIKSFAAGIQTSGVHGMMWDGTDDAGKKVAAGVYFYRLQAKGGTQVKKMVYGTSGGNFSFLPAQFPSQSSETGKERAVIFSAGTFAVRIENTDSTFPAVVSQEFDSVEVQSDTALNFTVSPIPVATVFLDSIQQVIRGFGAANIVQWRPDMTAGQIQTAFGTGPGQLGFSILRLRIPPDSTSFSVYVPTAKAASSMGVTVIATPWTPPAWMKSNNSTIGGYLNQSAYAAYAAHVKAFADTMSSNGVSLYAISVQNEPDANVNYESCYWNATQFLNFMKNNAPAVGVPVFMPESENFKHQLSDSTLNDPTAAANIAFIAGHIYGGGLTTYPLAVEKGKELWMTEHLDTDTTWAHVLATGKEINDCMNAGMSAYVWWYIVRFYGPIYENNGGPTKRGYVMSQYAKFVRPGFYKVSASPQPQRNVYVTAYKSGAKIVIVAINLNTSPVNQSFALQNGTAEVFASYVTSSVKSCAQGNFFTVSNGRFAAMLDASSVTTFISQ